MRKFLTLALSSLLAYSSFAQTKIQVKSDTVKVINGELVLSNNTKATQGYLYNIGNGITQFKPVDQFVDTLWASNDTIYYKKGNFTGYALLSFNPLNDPRANGMVIRTTTNTLATRTLMGTSGNIVVTNGDEVSGNPTFDLGTNVATLTANQILTGKTISGSSNTISNIGNSSLANSSISLAVGTSLTTPNWSSSSVALGGTAILNLPDYRPKSGFVTSDVTTTSTTASDITGLSIAVEANKTYRVTGTLFIGCNNTGGLRFAMIAPTGATLKACTIVGSNNSATGIQSVRLLTLGSLTTGSPFLSLNSSSGKVTWHGYIATGNTSGYIALQFASDAAGQTSTVFSGSGFDLQELR